MTVSMQYQKNVYLYIISSAPEASQLSAAALSRSIYLSCDKL